MMRKRVSLIPTASDGLAPVQRAVLRYLLARPEPPNCATIIKGLLAASDCPGEIDADTVDAALLTMSHPALCHTPLLTYHGSFGFEEGRLPGPVYRSVRLSPAALDLIVEAPEADDADDLWSPAPLLVRYPIALLLGSASWQLEIDERVPPEKWEQRERRVRCDCVHTLVGHTAAIERAMSRYRETGDFASCLTCLGENGPPIGCCVEPVAVGNDFAWGTWLRTQVNEEGNGVLPHGLLLGCRSPEQQETRGGTFEFLSLPVLQYINASPHGRPVLVVRQAGCGRCVGDEMTVLCRALGAQPFVHVREENGVSDDIEDSEVLPGVLLLPECDAAPCGDAEIASHIALEQLPLESFGVMLTQGR